MSRPGASKDIVTPQMETGWLRGTLYKMGFTGIQLMWITVTSLTVEEKKRWRVKIPFVEGERFFDMVSRAKKTVIADEKVRKALLVEEKAAKDGKTR